MRVVFLTAGAAGMYCGSCMHDNDLARALRSQDVDCVLQAIYTPIRTDTPSVAGEDVFFGGIHIYLLQKMPWLRFVPMSIRRALDWPALIRLATRRSSATDPTSLAKLTVSMLQGRHGRQASEVNRIVHWLVDEMQPDAVLLSNLLIGGALPELRTRLPDARLAVLLQGDDIFIDHLPQPWRDEVVDLMKAIVPSVDQFITHSRFYGNKMGQLLAIPNNKMVVTPLSIDATPYVNASPSPRSRDEIRIGYMARISPEKGLHYLVDAFIDLAQQPEYDRVTLHVAGWLGESYMDYLDEQRDKIESAGLTARFHYHGSPDLTEKASFLKSLDVMSVPTDYEEPKGLFVLESLAAGVPVVQPDHGAFGELIAATQGGLLVAPRDVTALRKGLETLIQDPSLRRQYGQAGQRSVLANHTIDKAAAELKQILSPHP